MNDYVQVSPDNVFQIERLESLRADTLRAHR
jgi:hypothetical protein